MLGQQLRYGALLDGRFSYPASVASPSVARNILATQEARFGFVPMIIPFEIIGKSTIRLADEDWKTVTRSVFPHGDRNL
jgi:hypothetical protein